MSKHWLQQTHILEAVTGCLKHFGVKLPDRTAVGLSGGKDSTTLMLVLRELGTHVIPITIDLGYRAFDASAIAENARHLGFDPIVVSVKDRTRLAALPPSEQHVLFENLHALDSEGLETPCGFCSRSKRILLLDEANRARADVLCLAHHRDDMITTLLKDYFADRYHRRIGLFERAKFKSFVAEEPIDHVALRHLVLGGRASTMAVRLGLFDSFSLLRPMAFVPESAIETFVASTQLRVHGSGCSHSMFQQGSPLRATKREIVHAELRRRLLHAPTLGAELLKFALLSLDASGRPWANPRAERSQLLPGFEN